MSFFPIESQWYIKSIIFTILLGKIWVNNYPADLICCSEDLDGPWYDWLLQILAYGNVWDFYDSDYIKNHRNKNHLQTGKIWLVIH